MGGDAERNIKWAHFPSRRELTIATLEGIHTASAGDWIIKGIKGEFYPCKPDIFAATYEPAEVAPPISERSAGE